MPAPTWSWTDLAELVALMAATATTRSSPDPMDRTRFPIDPWALTETGTRRATWASPRPVRRRQRLPRACAATSRRAGSPRHGTFINGFHETWQIRHAEEAFGFARTGQTIVNVPDNKTMKLYVDDEPMLLTWRT